MKHVIKISLCLLLGLFFIMAGGAKLMGEPSRIEHFAQWGYPLWFLYLTGLLEVGGGMCLFIPKAQWAGILGLSVIMIGAFFTHLRAGEFGALPVSFVLLCLLLSLAWLRYFQKKSLSSIDPSE